MNQTTHTQPSFLITIDTEGDNLWSKPRTITTRNAEFLPRFQSLCEAYNLKPTYLTNYEMALSPTFREFGREILKYDTGEIGMHLHAWNTPPLVPLTSHDLAFQPYLIEYPLNIMQEKIRVMTDLLEETFDCKMVTHRAGRWGFNETYAKMLVERGYSVDCSVTPHISWEHNLGHPQQNGGPNYTQYPDEAYFLNLEDISRPGSSPLLEIPMTISAVRSLPSFLSRTLKRFSSGQQFLERYFSPSYWLRTDGKNRNHLLRIIQHAVCENRSYIQFMLHSSEFMPGGSPTFPKENDIEVLYEDLEVLFDAVHERFVGRTLKEYHQHFVKRTNGNSTPK